MAGMSSRLLDSTCPLKLRIRRDRGSPRATEQVTFPDDQHDQKLSVSVISSGAEKTDGERWSARWSARGGRLTRWNVCSVEVKVTVWITVPGDALGRH